MRVHWTDRAKARLREIHATIAKDNPKAARRVIEKILRRSWQLGELPDTGHEVEGCEDTDLQEVLIRPYRLIYRKNAPRVDVITVLHYHQLLPGDLNVPEPSPSTDRA